MMMDPEDDTDHYTDNPPSPSSPSIPRYAFRKRSSRACDQCRKTKSRCDASLDGPCKTCQLSGRDCTYQGPSQKRGPPKGYLKALETRLFEAEALLGAIISSPKAEIIVAILSKDTLAEKIITRVNNSVFGTLGRPNNDKPQFIPSRNRRRPDREQQHMSNSQVFYSRESGNPVFTTPSYAWQDHLNERLASEGSASCSTLRSQSLSVGAGSSTAPPLWNDRSTQKHGTGFAESLPLESHTLSHHNLYSSPSSDAHESPEDLSDTGIGQLSFDVYQQIKYHSETSGLALLGKIPRIDALYHQQIWRLPHTYLSRLGMDPRPITYEDLEGAVTLPPRSVQEHLLRQYFHYVHPVFPIINRDEFWDQWTSMHKFGSGPAKLLLLAMFALAARYTDPETLDCSNQNMAAASKNYTDAAKLLLNKVYNACRLSTCQALLLLGYREIGMNGMTDASLFTVMATQMAQNLGLNRHADQWIRDSAYVFSVKQLQLRRLVWYGCVVLDAYIGAQLGQPLHVRQEDYDTEFPAVEAQEDIQLWMPYYNMPASQGYSPLPGQVTSCFRSLSSLAQIFAMILYELYAVRSDKTIAQKHRVSLVIDEKLQRWYRELTVSLRFTESPVPPPQILCLHMFYWCAVLLLQRTFIQLRSRDPQSSHKVFNLGAAAAINLTNIVHTYNTAFGLRHCPTLLTYYLMTAGVMHIVILDMHPTDIQAKLGLDRCLRALDEMKDTWPTASHVHAFLSGANVGAKTQLQVAPNDQPQKPQVDESSSGTSDHTNTSISVEESRVDMDIYHADSSVELGYSLGIELGGMGNVFYPSGDSPGTWHSGGVSFQGMPLEALPNSVMVPQDK